MGRIIGAACISGASFIFDAGLQVSGYENTPLALALMSFGGLMALVTLILFLRRSSPPIPTPSSRTGPTMFKVLHSKNLEVGQIISDRPLPVLDAEDSEDMRFGEIRFGPPDPDEMRQAIKNLSQPLRERCRELADQLSAFEIPDALSSEQLVDEFIRRFHGSLSSLRIALNGEGVNPLWFKHVTAGIMDPDKLRGKIPEVEGWLREFAGDPRE